MRRTLFINKIVLLAIILFAGFSAFQDVEASGTEKSLKITYPYEGAMFPLDFASPTFHWEDKSVSTAWRITLQFQDKGDTVSAKTTEPEWKPSPGLWTAIKQRSIGREITIKVQGINSSGKALSPGAKVTIRISKDSVNAPIFYREVILPAAHATRNLRALVWRLGDVSMEQLPPVVLTELPVCGNCHSFSVDGKYFAMDVDFGNDKGAYIVSEMKQEIDFKKESLISWSDYKKEDKQHTFGLLSQISPDGGYVISTVKDFSIFRFFDDIENSQLFFPVRGILVVYSRLTGKITALPGADDIKYVQTNPAWSPDGKWVTFARGDAIKAEDVKELIPKYVAREKTYRYDLYRIPFNGGKGGEATPLKGASKNNRSNYFPKYSPDGKWIVFCQADSFMLNQPDSRLYIMPAEGGTPRQLHGNPEPGMNSWHSWSPDSKWLVFSSKAAGPYTRLWLTHIDAQGRDTPPVMIENFLRPERAANIPEFVNMPAGTPFKINDKLHE